MIIIILEFHVYPKGSISYGVRIKAMYKYKALACDIKERT